MTAEEQEDMNKNAVYVVTYIALMRQYIIQQFWGLGDFEAGSELDNNVNLDINDSKIIEKIHIYIADDKNKPTKQKLNIDSISDMAVGGDGTNPKSFNEDAVVLPKVVSSSSNGSWNISAAVTALVNNSYAESHHVCAKHIRMAMEAGGMSTADRPSCAWKYHTEGFLIKKGFTLLGSIYGKKEQREWTLKNAQPGDIVVMNHGEYGHICMWSGKQWISDFRQNNMWVYGGDGRCYIYRFNG